MSQLLVNKMLSSLCDEYELQIDDKKQEFIDTQFILLCLIHAPEFSKSDVEWLDNFEYKINTTGKILTYYSNDWKPFKDSRVLSNEWMDIFTLLLYKNFLNIKNINKKNVELLKVINSVFKCLDLASSSWLKKGSELHRSIIEDFERIINNISQYEHLLDDAVISQLSNFNKPLVVLPITILFSEGPIARAYLATIHSMGFTPQKIIHLVPSDDITTKKPIGRLLPETVRKKYAAALHKQRIHYWPNKISKYLPELKKIIFDSVIKDYQFSQVTLDNANRLRPLSYFCSNIETLLIKNLRDDLLMECLQKLSETTILYTGGGFVPKDLLDIKSIKMIHIHPGFLPQIKGADCFLWSLLLHGRASASCFFMDDGLDTGEIILASWLPKISFKISRNNYNLITLYRSIYSYVDPWVRSFALRQVIKKYSSTNFYSISATKQDANNDTTLNFMHNKIKNIVMNDLFTNSKINYD